MPATMCFSVPDRLRPTASLRLTFFLLTEMGANGSCLSARMANAGWKKFPLYGTGAAEANAEAAAATASATATAAGEGGRGLEAKDNKCKFARYTDSCHPIAWIESVAAGSQLKVLKVRGLERLNDTSPITFALLHVVTATLCRSTSVGLLLLSSLISLMQELTASRY